MLQCLSTLVLLLHLPLLEEIIAFIIDYNECRKILNFHFPYGFHAYNQQHTTNWGY